MSKAGIFSAFLFGLSMLLAAWLDNAVMFMALLAWILFAAITYRVRFQRKRLAVIWTIVLVVSIWFLGLEAYIGYLSGAYYGGVGLAKYRHQPQGFFIGPYCGCAYMGWWVKLWPEVIRQGKAWDLAIPLWPISSLLWIIGGYYCWHSTRKILRYNPHRCRCSYDLTGNVSGRCPECSRPIPEALREQLGKSEPPS